MRVVRRLPRGRPHLGHMGPVAGGDPEADEAGGKGGVGVVSPMDDTHRLGIDLARPVVLRPAFVLKCDQTPYRPGRTQPRCERASWRSGPG